MNYARHLFILALCLYQPTLVQSKHSVKSSAPKKATYGILCTDIKKSSSLWQNDDEWMSNAILRHDAIIHVLVDSFNANNKDWKKNIKILPNSPEGDAFILYFPDKSVQYIESFAEKMQALFDYERKLENSSLMLPTPISLEAGKNASLDGVHIRIGIAITEDKERIHQYEYPRSIVVKGHEAGKHKSISYRGLLVNSAEKAEQESPVDGYGLFEEKDNVKKVTKVAYNKSWKSKRTDFEKLHEQVENKTVNFGVQLKKKQKSGTILFLHVNYCELTDPENDETTMQVYEDSMAKLNKLRDSYFTDKGIHPIFVKQKRDQTSMYFFPEDTRDRSSLENAVNCAINFMQKYLTEKDDYQAFEVIIGMAYTDKGTITERSVVIHPNSALDVLEKPATFKSPCAITDYYGPYVNIAARMTGYPKDEEKDGRISIASPWKGINTIVERVNPDIEVENKEQDLSKINAGNGKIFTTTFICKVPSTATVSQVKRAHVKAPKVDVP